MKKEEIENLVRLRNGLVELKEYYEICDSEQIDHVKYNNINNQIEIWGKDGTYVNVEIKKVLTN